MSDHNPKTAEFKREDRYIVIKRSDLEKVPFTYRRALIEPLKWLQTQLPDRKYLVIESDWPEHEPAWAMIEARMNGTQPEGMALHVKDVRKVVTDAMVSMVAGVTVLVPPSGPGAIPDFVQAPIDRAVTQITDLLSSAKSLSAVLAELALLQRVEQMAAYYEGPKGYFDWIDQQKAMRMPTGSGSPEGQNLPQQEADQ